MTNQYRSRCMPFTTLRTDVPEALDNAVYPGSRRFGKRSPHMVLSLTWHLTGLICGVAVHNQFPQLYVTTPTWPSLPNFTTTPPDSSGRLLVKLTEMPLCAHSSGSEDFYTFWWDNEFIGAQSHLERGDPLNSVRSAMPRLQDHLGTAQPSEVCDQGQSPGSRW